MSIACKSLVARSMSNGLNITNQLKVTRKQHSIGWLLRTRRFSNNVTNSKSQGSSLTTIRLISGATFMVIGGSVVGRLLYGSLMDDSNRGPKVDTSKAIIVLNGKMGSQDNKNGLLTKTVNATEFSLFLQQQLEVLRVERIKSQQTAKDVLEKELRKAILSEASPERIKMFADWYFSYATTWKLISKALVSAAKDAITFRKENSLSEAVSSDLQSYVCRKYEALVLRPAFANPKIHQAYVSSIKLAHEDYTRGLSEVEDSVTEFLRNAGYSTPPGSNDVTVDIDWNAQLQKVQHVPLAYEKTPEATIALVGMGVTVGKVAGGVATKTMLGKMVAPFVTKAVGATLSKGVAAGATTGGDGCRSLRFRTWRCRRSCSWNWCRRNGQRWYCFDATGVL